MESSHVDTLDAVAFTPEWAESWDELVSRSPNATFLHSRRFLSYHGDRFRDASLLLLQGESPVAVLPAAVDPAEPACVVSHPGATYGGLVVSPSLDDDAVRAALNAAIRCYADQGFARLHYKAVPHFYHAMPTEVDRYALFRSGARWVRSDLSATIDLAARGALSTRRRRALRKADQAGVRVVEGVGHAAALWPVVTATLQARHGVHPVHSLEEMLDLHTRFPTQIRFLAAVYGDTVVAGAVLFACPRAVHVQYSVASEAGRAVAALDAVLEHAIAAAQADGARYFDFGISTEEGGRRLNAGLAQYKREFGAGTCTYDHYSIDLKGTEHER